MCGIESGRTSVNGSGGDVQKHVREHERERLPSAHEDRQKAGRRAGGRGRDTCGM